MGSSDKSTASDTRLAHPDVRIAVENFGPIKNGAVDLRPLTVFVGPSNTGKTYFSILIYALRRILYGFPRLPVMHYILPFSVLHHDYDRFPKMDTTVQGRELKAFLEKLSSDERSIRFHDFPKSVRNAIHLSLSHRELFQTDLAEELMRCFDVESISDLARLSMHSNMMDISLSVSKEEKDLWHFRMEMSEPPDITAEGRIEDMILFPEGWWYSEYIGSLFSKLRNIAENESDSTWDHRHVFNQFMLALESFHSIGGSDTHYLPAARSGIMQSHRVIASSLVTRSTRAGLERFPELPTFSGVMADFMQKLILYEESGPDNKTMNELAGQLESEALAGKIRTKRPLSGGYPEFVYHPLNTEQDIRLTRASSMVSELAPVVLFLRGAIGRGDTLIIEEPEAHLHPAAQTRMAVTLARMVRAGVRVVVTTHSDWLLKEIGNLMREGELGERTDQPSSRGELPSALRPEEVGIWLFRKDGSASGSTVEDIPFDRIEGVEPQDYEDVAEALYNRSADLQNRLEGTKGEESAFMKKHARRSTAPRCGSAGGN